MAHPTPILQTTRPGKRDPVHRLNQPVCWDKLEPNRRNVRACTYVRKGEPGAKGTRLDRVLELDASPLLVILHYLLKNNTPFMGWDVQGRVGILDLLSTCKFTFGGAQPW
jgi:hypothetical protein